MVALAFTATATFEAIGLLTQWDLVDLNALAFLLILVYTLFRWGSGREALLGLPIVLGSATLGLIRDDLMVGEFLGGASIMLVPIALGCAARYRGMARAKELEDVRSSERLNLARELHDTVAHHVSAIAIRAQAGVATAAQNPDAVVDALHVVHGEASRTLEEMREMVRVLRDDEAATLTPAPRIEDLRDLAGGEKGSAMVSVRITGEVAGLSSAYSGAIFRIAQEAITNARRHARVAKHIEVEVKVDADAVHLRVQDDGAPVTEPAVGGGFGLMGMAERAQLLGGTLEAGPGSERGWLVIAILPFQRTDIAS